MFGDAHLFAGAQLLDSEVDVRKENFRRASGRIVMRDFISCARHGSNQVCIFLCRHILGDSASPALRTGPAHPGGATLVCEACKAAVITNTIPKGILCPVCWECVREMIAARR